MYTGTIYTVCDSDSCVENVQGIHSWPTASAQNAWIWIEQDTGWCWLMPESVLTGHGKLDDAMMAWHWTDAASRRVQRWFHFLSHPAKQVSLAPTILGKAKGKTASSSYSRYHMVSQDHLKSRISQRARCLQRVACHREALRSCLPANASCPSPILQPTGSDWGCEVQMWRSVVWWHAFLACGTYALLPADEQIREILCCFRIPNPESNRIHREREKHIK